MSREINSTFFNRWVDLGNGNLALADEIIGQDFVGHFPPTTSLPNEVMHLAATVQDKFFVGNAYCKSHITML